MKPTLQRLLELQRLLLDFSNVERVLHRRRSDQLQMENDTEHSYDLAMTAWYLAKWFPNLDKDKIIKFALVHDFVEVHAGDTFTYGSPEDIASKEQREAEALKKLQGDWSDFSDLTKEIIEYESLKGSEAKFVYALDKLMPIMMIYIHDGYSWKEHGITAKMLYDKKKAQVAKSPEIYPYFVELHDLLMSHPEIIKAK